MHGPTNVTLIEALAEVFHSRLDMDDDEDLGEREEALLSAVVGFDDEPDPLTAIDYVLGFLLDARDLIGKRNGGVIGSTLVYPSSPLATLPNYDLVHVTELSAKARELEAAYAAARSVCNGVAEALRDFNDGGGSIDAIQCLDRITMTLEG